MKKKIFLVSMLVVIAFFMGYKSYPFIQRKFFYLENRPIWEDDIYWYADGYADFYFDYEKDKEINRNNIIELAKSDAEYNLAIFLNGENWRSHKIQDSYCIKITAHQNIKTEKWEAWITIEAPKNLNYPTLLYRKIASKIKELFKKSNQR